MFQTKKRTEDDDDDRELDLDFLSADFRLVNVGEDSARGRDSSSLRSILSQKHPCNKEIKSAGFFRKIRFSVELV